jgi:hypothetical protein
MASSFHSLTAYNRSLLVAITVQLMLLVLGLLATDCGEWTRAVLLAAVAFWPVTLMLAIRRPTSPTRPDLMFVRYGYPVIFGVLLFWHLMGT